MGENICKWSNWQRINLQDLQAAHGENARYASGWCNITPASAAAGSPWTLYPSLPPAWVSQSPQISCSFNPILSGRGRDALRRPTRRDGSKSKAKPQELCEQRREREISPSSLRSSGLIHNQLDVPASVEYLNRQRIIPNWGGGLWEQWYTYVFPFFSFCECVCVCFCVWFCLYSFSFTICPRVLSVSFVFVFFTFKKFFLNNYFNNYFILSLFFLYLFIFYLLFWAMQIKGSWCSSQGSGLCLWEGRAKFRTLVHQRPPSST